MGGGSAPPPPTILAAPPPPAPPPVAPPPAMDQTAVNAATKKSVQAASQLSGRASTILTQGQGNLQDKLG